MSPGDDHFRGRGSRPQLRQHYLHFSLFALTGFASVDRVFLSGNILDRDRSKTSLHFNLLSTGDDHFRGRGSRPQLRQSRLRLLWQFPALHAPLLSLSLLLRRPVRRLSVSFYLSIYLSLSIYIYVFNIYLHAFDSYDSFLRCTRLSFLYRCCFGDPCVDIYIYLYVYLSLSVSLYPYLLN